MNLSFSTWLSLQEVDNGMDPDTGQIYDQAKYDAWKKARKQQAAQQNAAFQGKTIQDVLADATKLIDKWIEQPRVKAMLLQAVGRGEDLAQHPAFLAIMKGQNYSQQIIDRIAFQLTNKLKYYYDTLPVAQVAGKK